MSLGEEKLKVLQHIINSDDGELIKDQLTRAQQDDVKEGLAQLDNGDTFSHEEAKKRFLLNVANSS